MLDFRGSAVKPNFLIRVTQLKHFIVVNNNYIDSDSNSDTYREMLTKYFEALKIATLFSTIAKSVDEGNCKLKSLSLNTCIYEVDPMALLKMVGSLQKLDLSACYIGFEEVEAFVDAILESVSLKMLELDRYFHYYFISLL